MTPKQKDQFNRMRDALKAIATKYATPDRLRDQAMKEYGLDFEEVIEMAYQNIQAEAAHAVKGVRAMK